MDPITVLPDTILQPNDIVAETFMAQGLKTFHEACQWTKNLPYGANSSNEDSLILFEEGCGTCTTKHGAIARLARAHNLPVHKALGFYRLSDEIVTGVDALIQAQGLDFIPQIHCFLAYDTYRVDLTAGNCNGKNKIIEDYDFVVLVAPDLTQEQHQAYYREYLQQYRALAPQLSTVSDAAIFDLLAACDLQVKYQCSIMTEALTPS